MEKTEKATPKRRRKAREDGQIAKSAEFSGVAVMLGAIAVIVVTGAMIGQRLVGLMLQAIEVATRDELDTSSVAPFIYEAAWTTAAMMAPLVGVTFVVAAVVTYLQVGPLLTVKPVIPDATKLDMVQGMKQIVSPDKLVDLAKNVAKLGAMGWVGYLVLKKYLPPMAMTPRGNLLDGGMALAQAALQLALFLVAGLVLFGILDLIWQRYQHEKRLRMAKHEVKRENKEAQGDPMIKGKRKQAHREILADAGGGLKNVSDADAVVVNPTHVAAAIRYREQEMTAPTIVACGRGVTARKIKQLARRHGVPIVRNVDLARALVDVGLESQIPADLFEPVAEVLHHVYELKD